MKESPFAASGQLFDVGDDHQLYVEEIGSGLPVVFLHGGPGSGCRPEQHALFDRRKYRAIFFDQRGAGRSRPHRLLSSNTTDDLVNDLEAIRSARGIARWLLVGGSWGATLALAYAERHPDRVAGIVLRAVFLGTRAELDWAFVEGPRKFHPRLLDDFLSILPPEERDDPLPAYWRRILDPDPAMHRQARWAWHDTERVLSELASPATRIDRRHQPADPLTSTPLFEAHYFSHDCFLTPNQLLREAGRLTGIPGAIVQGRYDLLCPPTNSAALADAWPDAEVTMVESAGHSMREPGIMEAMIKALEAVAARASF